MQQDVLEWADVVAIGSPTHYGNVASGLLAWVEKEWEGETALALYRYSYKYIYQSGIQTYIVLCTVIGLN